MSLDTVKLTMTERGKTAAGIAVEDPLACGGWRCKLENPSEAQDERETFDPVGELRDMLDLELRSLHGE